MPASNQDIAASSDPGACCRDAESGLFTLSHFNSVLSQELARLDRWERPLSLVILETIDLNPESWPVFGRLLLDSLRRIDLAARIGSSAVAVILPDAETPWARRWLCGFAAELGRQPLFSNLALRYGQALARPWTTAFRPEELVALAMVNLKSGDPKTSADDDDISEANSATAVAADEKTLLFEGFKVLGLN